MNNTPHAVTEQYAPNVTQETTSAMAWQVPLQAITLTFTTLNDDKDGDTVVSVSIDNGATLMGQGNVGGGQSWNDGSTNVARLPVVNAVDFYACASQHMNITIHPNGNDTWNFNVTLREDFALGAWRQVSWSGISLAEDRPSVDLNVSW